MTDFWHFYLHEHARPATRALHITGTTIAFLCLVAAAILLNPWFLLAGIIAGYGFAWVGHFFVEHNRPATFKHPWKSLAADWKMWALAITGRLGKELEDHGLSKGS